MYSQPNGERGVLYGVFCQNRESGWLILSRERASNWIVRPQMLSTAVRYFLARLIARGNLQLVDGRHGFAIVQKKNEEHVEPCLATKR